MSLLVIAPIYSLFIALVVIRYGRGRMTRREIAATFFFLLIPDALGAMGLPHDFYSRPLLLVLGVMASATGTVGIFSMFVLMDDTNRLKWGLKMGPLILISLGLVLFLGGVTWQVIAAKPKVVPVSSPSPSPTKAAKSTLAPKSAPNPSSQAPAVGGSTATPKSTASANSPHVGKASFLYINRKVKLLSATCDVDVIDTKIIKSNMAIMGDVFHVYLHHNLGRKALVNISNLYSPYRESIIFIQKHVKGSWSVIDSSDKYLKIELSLLGSGEFSIILTDSEKS